MLIIYGSVIGALLGSFIGLVASRGPRLWGLVEAGGRPSGLAQPPSQCEECGRRLPPWELIPILGYIVLRGRCRGCGAAIGLRHLLIELLGAGLGALIVWRYGLHADAALALVLIFPLACLALIDFETGYLPDALTLPLIAVGLAASALPGGLSPVESVAGAAAGGGGLWLIAWAYRTLRGREGLGGGDVKLIAAAGAWCGALALPAVLLAASLTGLAYAGAAMVVGRTEHSLKAEVRFGPFLCTAIAIVYMLGPRLMFA